MAGCCIIISALIIVMLLPLLVELNSFVIVFSNIFACLTLYRNWNDSLFCLKKVSGLRVN